MNVERKRKTMDYIKAFLIGGMICALAQVLLDRTRLMPGRVMVLLVVSGCILGFAGVYEPFARWAGAGASVPLLGFGNTLWKGVKEGIEKEGLLGIFKGGLTASSAGICGALVFGYLSSLVFQPKLKE
jgi:stage V sporulation protein AE